MKNRVPSGFLDNTGVNIQGLDARTMQMSVSELFCSKTATSASREGLHPAPRMILLEHNSPPHAYRSCLTVIDLAIDKYLVLLLT